MRQIMMAGSPLPLAVQVLWESTFQDLPLATHFLVSREAGLNHF